MISTTSKNTKIWLQSKWRASNLNLSEQENVRVRSIFNTCECIHHFGPKYKNAYKWTTYRDDDHKIDKLIQFSCIKF